MFWPFKKKKVEKPINSKFHHDQFVYFRYRDELYFGFVVGIYSSPDQKVLYDIQVMGQCPSVIHAVKEETMFVKDKN